MDDGGNLAKSCLEEGAQDSSDGGPFENLIFTSDAPYVMDQPSITPQEKDLCQITFF